MLVKYLKVELAMKLKYSYWDCTHIHW